MKNLHHFEIQEINQSSNNCGSLSYSELMATAAQSQGSQKHED